MGAASDPTGWQIAMSLMLGLGLAASCGFRIFVPLLIISIGHRAEMITLGEGFTWVGSTPALVALALATAFEIAAYYIPWVDNLLDTVAVPAAVIAGAVVTAAAVQGMDPLVKWTVAVIIGGGAAGAVSAAMATVRAISSAATSGLANSFVSTAEAGAATGLSVLSIIFTPLAMAVVLGVMGYIFYRFFIKRKATLVPQPAHTG